MRNFLIGIDVGTSAAKGVMISTDGSVKYTAKSPFIYDRPAENKVEIPADRYIEAMLKLTKELSSNLEPGDRIAGLCEASASGNLLLLDENDRPLTPIYGWQDFRAKDEFWTVFGKNYDKKALFRKVGWSAISDSFPLAQLCVLKVNQPELIDKAGTVCMSTEYFNYVLTGCWGISISAGTPFVLIDQQTRKYIPELIDTLGIPESKLPPIVPTGSVVGFVTDEAAALSGLPAGTPILAGTFDHPGAGRGTGVLEEGQLLLSCGTSWVGFFPCNDRSKVADNGMLCDPFLTESQGPWAGMISLESVSEKIHYLTEKYIAQGPDRYVVLSELSSQSEIGAGGLSISIYGEDDEETIRKFEKRHIARAIMEGTVSELKKELDRIEGCGIKTTSAIMVGGPSEDKVWRQVMHEITGMEIEYRNGAFAGAVGASIIAGISMGVYSGYEDALSVINCKN